MELGNKAKANTLNPQWHVAARSYYRIRCLPHKADLQCRDSRNINSAERDARAWMELAEMRNFWKWGIWGEVCGCR